MLLNDAEFTQIKVMIERKLEKFLELSQLNNWYSEHDTERFPLQKTLIIHKNFRAPRGFLFFRVSFYSRFRVMHARARTRTQELNALPLIGGPFLRDDFDPKFSAPAAGSDRIFTLFESF